MNESLMILEQLSKIVAFISAAVAALGAMVQYALKVREERRLSSLAILETDVKTSQLFSELICLANGYGASSEPQKEVIEDILRSIPQEVKQNILMSDPRQFSQLVGGSRVTKLVPLSQQLAAAEAAASLAIRYPFLKEAGIVGLEVVAGYMPQACAAYERVCRHYGIQRLPVEGMAAGGAG